MLGLRLGALAVSAVFLFGCFTAMNASATVLKAEFTGSINRISPDLSLYDLYSTIDSSDIVLGAEVTGEVLFDTALAPPDDEPAPDLAAFRDAGFTGLTYWVSTSLQVGGGEYFPANGSLAFGDVFSRQFASPLMIIRDEDPVGGADSLLRFTEGMEITIGGVEQNRDLHFHIFNIPFQDALPSVSENLTGGLGYGTTSIVINPGAANDRNSFFEFSVDSFSNLEEIRQVPEPTSLVLVGLGLVGLVYARKGRVTF